MNTFKARKVRSRLGTTRSALLMTTGLFAMNLAPFASANTIYSYTGNDYATCGGTYCTGGPYALSVTFRTTLSGVTLNDLPFTNITSTITTYEFTDGSGLTFNSSSNPAAELEINVSTNASGNIVAWFAGAYSFPADIQMQTNWDSPFGFIRGADFSETTSSFAGDFGFISNLPGTWEMRPVPEPSTLVLLAAGLLVAVIPSARRADRKAI